MPEYNRLAQARNAHPDRLTQRDLGVRMASELGLTMSDKYAQKKVSLWESGHGRPNKQETAALAKVLQRAEEEIQFWFAKTPASAEELFDQLAATTAPSLLVACYSGRPRATVDADARQALLAALQANTSFAMVFPYTLDFQGSGDEDVETLLHFYTDVWFEVKALWQALTLSLPLEKKNAIRLYRPAISGSANILLPPIGNSRFTQVIEAHPTSQPSKTLYSWVEAEKEGLYLIGTFSSRDVHDQMLRIWDAYFGEISRSWLKNGLLPESAPRWQSYSGAYKR